MTLISISEAPTRATYERVAATLGLAADRCSGRRLDAARAWERSGRP